MPRRATATSYGNKSGNPQGAGPAKGEGGAPTKTFVLAMQRLASRHETLRRLEAELDSEDPRVFLKAFAEVADRGYGKALQPLEHSGFEGIPDEQVEARVMEIVREAARKKREAERK